MNKLKRKIRKKKKQIISKPFGEPYHEQHAWGSTFQQEGARLQDWKS